MKTERKQETKAEVYALTPEVIQAIEAVHDAIARRKVLDEAVNEAPARIAALEQEADRMRGELARLDADIALCDDAEVPAKERAIKKLDGDLSTKETELRRARARLDALEARAPEIDAAVSEAGYVLNLETNSLAESFKERISEELREAVKPLLPILEKARAVGPLMNDFCQAAYLPDPAGFYLARSNNNANFANIGFNLLSGASGLPNPINEVMAPVNAALAAWRGHKPYLPLAKRPVPYVRKGAWDGPGGRVDRPDEPEQPPAPRMKTLEEALAEPYTIKGDSSGIRTWQAAAEMNMAKALADAADSADH